MKEKFRRMMQGRYGLDGYGRFLSMVALICLIIGTFTSDILVGVSLALLFYCYFRMFSRNVQKRAQENETYYAVVYELRSWFARRRQRRQLRKQYRFYRCPKCRQQLRVPRGKGKIEITCPACKASFRKKS